MKRNHLIQHSAKWNANCLKVWAKEENQMKALFRREVTIRLSEDGTAFVSTVKYGRFFSKTTAIPLNRQSLAESVEDKALVPVRKRSQNK